MNPSFRIGFKLPFALGQMTVLGDNNLIRCDRSDLAAIGGENNSVRVPRDLIFQSSTHQGRLGYYQRHTLALHIGTHQRPVRVVVFEEGNEARCHRHELFR